MENGKRNPACFTGFHPQRWRELLSAEREVVLEPDGRSDPSIAYAVVWKQKPNLLSSLHSSAEDAVLEKDRATRIPRHYHR